MKLLNLGIGLLLVGLSTVFGFFNVFYYDAWNTMAFFAIYFLGAVSLGLGLNIFPKNPYLNICFGIIFSPLLMYLILLIAHAKEMGVLGILLFSFIIATILSPVFLLLGLFQQKHLKNK